MNVRDLMNLLKDFHGEDEVVAITQKGRLMLFTQMDEVMTSNQGRVVLLTEWANKHEDEILPYLAKEDIKPEEEHPHYARAYCMRKWEAIRQYPWTSVTIRMVDGWMCFDSQREMMRWMMANKNNPEINVNAPLEMRAENRYKKKTGEKRKRGRPRKHI